MLRSGSLLATALCLVTLIPEETGAEMSDKPFFSKPIEFGLHRGGAKWRPESTLFCFREAVERWPHALLETDARMTKDGVAVLLHDSTVNRTTNGTGAIADLTYDEIKDLDAGYRFTPDGGETYPYRGTGVRIPTVREALEALPDTHFLVELKDQPGIADGVVKAIQDAGAEDRVMLASFNPAHMQRAKELAPGIARCFHGESLLTMVRHLRDGTWEEYVREDDVFIFDYRRLDRYLLTAEDFPALKAKGIRIMAYTIDDPAELRAAFEQGIDGILTDRPDITAPVVEAINAER